MKTPNPNTRSVRVNSALAIGGGRPLALIAGPCALEDRAHAIRHAKRIRDIARGLRMPYIFKSSYDKANRLSIASYRGPGLRKGLDMLRAVKEAVGVPVLSDVHGREEVEPAARVLDVIQIPAFLCRQTDLIVEAARTQKPVNVKKGQFVSPWDMERIVEKLERTGNRRILLTERGFTFGYRNLVSDMRSLAILRSFGYPVVFDATHSVQLPGGQGHASGGERQFVPVLARAAVAAGCDALFLEVHERPDRAPSDGATMVRLGELEALLEQVLAIDEALRRCRTR